MKTEISIGIILIKGNPLKFLLLKRMDNKMWDFPKGHLRNGETHENCAIRELKEETQISRIFLFKDFKEEFTFTNPKGSSRKIILFLGKTSRKDPILSEEHTHFKWCNYEKAYYLVKFKEKKDALNKVKNYLKTHLLR